VRVGVLRALHIAEYPISDDDWKRAYAEVRAQYPAATFLKAPLAWIGLGLSGHLWGRAGVQAYPLSPTRYRLCQRRDSGEDREAESSKTLPGRHSQKLLLLQNQQVLKSVWLKLFVCTLQHLHIGPRLSRQSSRVLTPQMRGAILIRDVDILKALGLRDIVNAVAGQHDEVRLIISQVTDAVGVLDREPELFWKLGETLHIGCFLQKLREFFFELVMARNKVEDALVRDKRRPRPWERWRFG
jgi:hypothetical protein